MAVSGSLRGFSFAFAAPATCLLASAAMAEDTAFVIRNTTGTEIAEVYAYPFHYSEGPGEPLPQSTVPAGASATFTIADGFCAYELYFAFADGRWYHDTADFCEFPTYVFKPVAAGWVELE